MEDLEISQEEKRELMSLLLNDLLAIETSLEDQISFNRRKLAKVILQIEIIQEWLEKE